MNESDQQASDRTPEPRVPASRSIAADAESAAQWFVATARQCLGENLLNATIYGPAVTSLFNLRQHQIHPLLVTAMRDLDLLLGLAKYSKQATRRRIAPPLIVTADSLRQSWDVFPLEWLDIVQFHRTMWGDPVLVDFAPKPMLVRLQCERDLRFLDILLQRGVLASGGRPGRIARLEDQASDTLIRVLRGIGWLVGDREPLLPSDVCSRCEAIIGQPLPGCVEAIRDDGRHDITTVRLMLAEIGQMSDWIDSFKAVDE